PALVGANASPGADAVVLVKPQFEAGRVEASRGRGVIRDPVVWLKALEQARGALEAAGAAMMGAMVSPVLGADGNVEFLFHASAHAGAAAGRAVDLAALTLTAAAGREG
ncbi:MAG: 16S/23S rRNA (cytidine-2'-O)-methyltransferase, partial [Acidimicrobiales bacterium]